MKQIILFFGLILLQACTVYGVTNDYKKLTDTEKATVVPLKNFNETDSQHIYKVNGPQLVEELKKYPKAIVYTFVNGCSSSSCLPMSTYEQFAKGHNYKLYFVMQGYGSLYETTKQRSELFTLPLFSMDNDFYDSWYSGKYGRYFRNDLRGIDRKAKPEWAGSLFFFEYGKFIKVLRELPNS